MTIPLGIGCRLEPAPDLRSIDQGRILIGGSPLRILRLQQAGADLVGRWFAGDEVSVVAAHHDLARRLEHNGMAHLRWPDNPPTADPLPTMAVIVPSRDDGEALGRTLAARPDAWADEVIVVDDGSSEPVTVTSRAVEVVRRPVGGGPAAARQTGLATTTADVVLFLDAGVILTAADAAGLITAFRDPAVVAAAPRVRSEPLDHLVGRYDVGRSPLDLGPSESLVGPGRLVTYVPTACLAVRATALREVGGFDTTLRYGEDVDLVWRLGRIGLVRYLPGSTAIHRPRDSLAAMLAQRHSYGSSAAALAKRHGADPLAPCRVSPWTALVVALALSRRPLSALVTAVGTGLALKPKLEPMPDARIEAIGLTMRGHWYGGLSILTAMARDWAPLLLPLLAIGGWPRRLAARILIAAAARRLVDGPRDPGDALVDVSVGLADDLAYCAGLWQGAMAERSTAPLRPVLSSWPGGGPSLRKRAATLRSRLVPATRR